MVELRINGNLIELPKNGDGFKLTRQIADVLDLAAVASSYTTSFNIPKTPINTQNMQYLGIPGDSSSIPYSKNEVNVKYSGFDAITKGWLNVSETTDDYKSSIIDGMIDFFKAIENKTLGADLDLSNFDHTKTIETVIASYDNEYYSYIIADYGARTQILVGFEVAINIDPLPASFSMKKLLELIMSTFGYTYESEELDLFLEELYITYPTPPVFESTDDTIIAELNKGAWVKSPVQQGNRFSVPSERYWTTSDITEGTLVNSWMFKVTDAAGYFISIATECYVRYVVASNNINEPLYFEVTRNGFAILTLTTDPVAEVTGSVNVFCQEGDIIDFNIYAPLVSGSQFIDKIHHKNTDVTISKINQGDIKPLEAFKSFKITDFFKELLYRTGLIPIADNVNRKITFLNVSERIDRTNAIDWTDKYIGRKKEVYVKNSYAQRNLFKMKYNTEGDVSNDGVLLVNNANIEAEKTLVQSLFYSPIAGTSEVQDTSAVKTKVPIITMWQAEASKDDEGETQVTYKPYDNRFYLLRRYSKSGEWNLSSEVIPGIETANNLWFANIENTMLGQLVDQNFSEYNKIFQNFRGHDIELALGLSDILSLNLKVPYYFMQEGAYYIINKITYEQGKTSSAECVKINY